MKDKFNPDSDLNNESAPLQRRTEKPSIAPIKLISLQRKDL